MQFPDFRIVNGRGCRPPQPFPMSHAWAKPDRVRSPRISRSTRAPVDNNLVERILKKAILHRRNSLFYKTLNGARVGDLFMSLIHTCELNGANPFDYLAELLRHAEELKQSPSGWMPWNYRETLARSVAA